MSKFRTERLEWLDAKPEAAFVFSCLRVLTAIGDVGGLVLSESSYFNFTETVSALNVYPHIRERLMAGHACEMAARAVEAGKTMPVIDVNVKNVIMMLMREEEGLAWALGESTEFSERSGFSVVPASIESLERSKYGTTDSDQSKCTICLDTFSMGSDILRNGCMTEWL